MRGLPLEGQESEGSAAPAPAAGRSRSGVFGKIAGRTGLGSARDRDSDRKGSGGAWHKMEDLGVTPTQTRTTDSGSGAAKTASTSKQHEEDEVLRATATRSTVGVVSNSSTRPLDGRGGEEGRRGRRGFGIGRRREQTYSHTHFKVYKRRWFGLAQLVLLNVVVSWDVCIRLQLLDTQTLMTMSWLIVANVCACFRDCGGLLWRLGDGD
jgi:hypothetical protein